MAKMSNNPSHRNGFWCVKKKKHFPLKKEKSASIKIKENSVKQRHADMQFTDKLEVAVGKKICV